MIAENTDTFYLLAVIVNERLDVYVNEFSKISARRRL